MHRVAMSPISCFAGLLLALAAAGARAEATDANVVYAYAQVLRVSVVYVNQRVSAPDPRCRGGTGGAGGTGGTVAGALVGGALGHQVGTGDGRSAATVAGAVLGGALGHRLATNTVPEGCRNGELERTERRIAGYDVEYQYQGQTYMSRLPVDPGNRVRVRVTVTPDDPALGIR